VRKNAAVVLCALAATGLMAVPPAQAANASVTLQNIRFTPDDVSVSVGDTVTWTHMDGSTPHTVTADDGSFNSSPNCDASTGIGCMTGGAKFNHRFDQAGTVSYHCNVHPNMTGVVRVGPAPGPQPTPQPAPSPAPGTASPATTRAAPTTSRPTTTTTSSSSTTTTIAPPAAADAGTTSSTTAAAGGGVALPANKTSSSDDGVSPWLVALAIVLVLGAGTGGVLLRRLV
jgi:plastocyanin